MTETEREWQESGKQRDEGERDRHTERNYTQKRRQVKTERKRGRIGKRGKEEEKERDIH